MACSLIQHFELLDGEATPQANQLLHYDSQSIQVQDWTRAYAFALEAASAEGQVEASGHRQPACN